MRKTIACLVPSLLLCLLTLAVPAPAARSVKAAPARTERCEECLANVQARYDQCLAIFGADNDPRGQRCHDQFNEGISQCYRNFCEQ